MSSNIYSSIKSDNSFGKVHSVLKNSGMNNFLQIVSSSEVLKQKLSGSIDKDIKDKDEFYETLSYIFQSLTNIGYTTYEILEFICDAINAEGVYSDDEKKEIIDFLSNSFCFVHTSYTSFPLWENNKNILKKILFGHDNVDYFNMGLVLGKTSSQIVGRFPHFKRNLKTLSALTGATQSSKNNLDNFLNLKRFYKSRNLNNNVRNPSKREVSVSSILISNPDIRIGSQNSLELSTFFNGLPTLELNRSYPYLNATFILPSLVKQTKDKKTNKFKSKVYSSTINSFLFGNIKNKTQNYDNLSGEKMSNGTVKTNMSLFTSPQTMINFDEPIGHSQNNKINSRKTTVHDPTQPLITIKGFSINSSATKGLMSYKSGTLSVTLHDRTRMNEIAPFIKPDLLGSFGAEIILEYGWSNPDENNPSNPIGYFIGNSKITEKYMIVNSSMSMDNNGQVNIELSIAMKGPHEFKNQQISSKVNNRILESEFKEVIGDFNYDRGRFINKDVDYFQDTSLNDQLFNSMFSETSRLSDSQVDSISSFTSPHSRLLSVINGNLSNHLVINPAEDGISVTIKGLQKNETLTFCNLLNNDKSIRKSIDEKLSSGSDEVQFIVKNKLSSAVSFKIVKDILESVENIITLSSQLTRQDMQEGDNERKIIESIMGSVSYIDHFYPTSKKLYPKKDPTDYISLGSVINTIVQHYIAKPKGRKSSYFDEIQTIFYTANDHAALMSNENLANFLIDRKMLAEFLKGIFQNTTIITPESLIAQILKDLVQVEDNVTLGLSDLYEDRKRDYRKPVEQKKSLSSTNKFSNSKKERLAKIYGVDLRKNKDLDMKFKMPIIHMNFDCLTSGGVSSKNKERSILRISIYDRNDSPFSASSTILENIYTGNYKNSFGRLLSLRKDYIKNKREDKNYERENLSSFNKKQKSEIDKLIKKQWVTKNKDGSYSLNPEKINNKENFIGNIKDVYKETYPSLTFGSQNSIILNANVTTINDNKLATVFMTRPDRNDQNLINNRVVSNMPLVIMPSQASIEIFGCPWVNFGQSVFLDFETGTTIDNKYVITGISHNLSPGKYTTQLTLSYADNYGQLKNIEDTLNENTPEVKKKKRKEKTVKARKKTTSTYTIDPNYTSSSHYDKRLQLINRNIK